MDFSLSDEQQQLRDSALRFVREHASFERWQKTVVTGNRSDSGNWQRMADLGWLAITVPEAHGGLGGTPADTMALMEALGGGFMLEPYVSTCVLAPRVLLSATKEVQADFLPAIAEGRMKIAVALGERDGGFDIAEVATTAKRDGDTFAVSGFKSYVPDGPAASAFIVPVRTAGAPSDAQGITLLLVDAASPGLSKTSFRSIDHRPEAQLQFDDVTVPVSRVLGQIDHGLETLGEAIDHAIAAELAEALGVMEAAKEQTLAYLKTREQFGVKIGSFQALQHRMADIAIACEETRSLVFYATASLDLPRDARRRAISAAKARVGQCGLFVGHQCVQLHGGIGTSDEVAVSHALRRLRMLDMRFGNADHHRSIFAGLSRG